MAAGGRRANRPLIDRLKSEPHRFDFFQAVKLIEMAAEKCDSVGTASVPANEAVEFKAHVSQSFPASQLYDIIQESGPEDDRLKMIVTFMGLAGALGPMPAPYTELIMRRVRKRDTAFRDFLDIFNHRLLSLFYRVRKTGRIAFEQMSPEKTHFARYLFSLLGLGTHGLSGRMRIQDRALLNYTALFSQKPRSMMGLELTLSDYFDVDVKGTPLAGRWFSVEEDQITRLGISGKNRILGRDALIGSRVHSTDSMFEVSIGPLPFDRFYDFLPVGTAFLPLCQITRFYAGNDLSFAFRLLLLPDHVPETRLGATPGPRLGWTSFLRRKAYRAPLAEIRLSPDVLTMRLGDLAFDEPV